MFINNHQCVVRSTPIDLNPDDIHYYSFTLNVDRCDGSYNTVEDLFLEYCCRICIPNLTEDVDLKVFNMMKEISESKTLIKNISCEYKCEFDGRKYNSKQSWNNDKCYLSVKKPNKTWRMRRRLCLES